MAQEAAAKCFTFILLSFYNKLGHRCYDHCGKNKETNGLVAGLGSHSR